MNDAEIEALHGEQSSNLRRVYNVNAIGNWKGMTILNRLHSMKLLDDAMETKIAEGRKILLDARVHRIPPGKETKVVAPWNGLMIAALDDHADLAHAVLALYESTGKDLYRQDAKSFVDEVERQYKDANGANSFPANDTPNLITRTKTVNDNATPSNNCTLVSALARLYYLTRAELYLALTGNIVRAFGGKLPRNFFPLSTLINSSELLPRVQQIVIVGDRDEAETESLVDCFHSRSLPDRLLNVFATPNDLPARHSAEGREKLEARATAYVCNGPVCSSTINTTTGLTAFLDGAV